MATDLRTYSKRLAEQLRINGMKEEQVQEVVAEVQQHVLDTRQDPLEAFGQPTDYATTWIATTPRRWVVRSLAAVAGVTSLLTLSAGLAAPVGFADSVDIDASSLFLWLTWCVCLGVMPWTAEIWLARRGGRRLGRARGAPVTGLLIAACVLVMTVVYVGGSRVMSIEGPVFASPRWALVAIGIIGLPGIAFVGSRRNASLPDRPGTRRTWRTRVRRAFVNW